MSDVDNLEYSFGMDGSVVFNAIIENKFGMVEEINLQESSIKMLQALADKLSVPFLLCITYVDPNHFKIPMYYVLPLNQLATDYNTVGWLTVKQFSYFLHTIRDIKFNYLEWIPATQSTLGELSNDYMEYNLPIIRS